ncbi:flagellar motor protein MotB [Flavobacterium amnicola]|uniref:Flagellar motor protein MotB n=1 Tax=Flavobacterium amnicola TaxID=2506422 RepID=A0A4Q1K441_9FLAO|nr:OmpA family protein [Flavobacterium amnicola]RXR19181.1 flagellar motor protein MotB [Flavobacterium amnicola]
MSKQTTYLLGILATIVLGSLLYSKFCCKCCEPKDKTAPNTTKVNTDIESAFHLKGSDFEYNTEKNFNFSNNFFNHLEPVDANINIGIEKLKTYFDKKPNGSLLITGYCLTTEKNTSAFPNLGFARANDVKNYFISKGIPSNRFEINGEIKAALTADNQTLVGPITYAVSNDIVDTKGDDWNALKEKITEDPLILYFNTNQTEINLTPEERQKIADLSTYLDHVQNAKISCVGHSDSVGDRNINIQLGKERADFAKEYLVKNGINPERIEATSKGPDEPIADNLTPEGKAKNRRTVITLK